MAAAKPIRSHMSDRRVEERFLCADIVRLNWSAGDVNARSEQARLEDISRLGGCVQLEEPVPPGSVMMLTVGTTPFFGDVCSCTLRDEAYFIGLRFSNETAWSAVDASPKHLTRLERRRGWSVLAHEHPTVT
jgi:hypothetical protein